MTPLAMLARVKAMIDAGETPAELPVHVVIGLTSVAGYADIPSQV